MKTPYENLIVKLTTHNPRWVEAYMRSENGTLDHLTKNEFKLEVELAEQCIVFGGDDLAEKVAMSYGL